MSQGSKTGRRRWVTRGALLRLGALALILLLFGLGSYTMMFRMPGTSFSGPLPPLTAEETALSERLRSHVKLLAGEIGERNAFHPAELERAAAWIEGELRRLGLAAGKERGDVFETRDGSLRGPVSCRNVCAELPGKDPAGEIVLLGAHYDSVIGTPGANDNASGAAALIEIARSLAGRAFRRTLRFVAFANEEPPFFQTASMGSLVHARASRARGDRIAAMISLETLGYYSDLPGSQSYPSPLDRLYPSTGNFIAFVGDFASRALVKECLAIFRESTQFPSEGGAPPGFIPGVGWSDHWSFWQAGYRAIMVTDTATYRYPHYHDPADTPENLDYDRFARVTAGLARLAARLAEGG